MAASGAALFGLLVAAPAAAEPAPQPPTPEAVGAFLDERVPALLAEFDVPGAAVAVTGRDATLYQQGYGFADIASGTPVSAEETAFATASVAKSFTATALLQLVDAGRVDLHADVNDYLPDGITVPDTYPGRPVTLHHLLTHTAGFEEAIAGMEVERPDQVLSLREYVRRYVPQRVEPPGRFTAYSNYGVAMVGLVIEEVSGQEFTAYVDQHVLGPLDMDRTIFAQAAEARKRLQVPTFYHYGEAGNSPTTDVIMNGLPAGSGYATASDMARFMRTLLCGGELDGRRVLSEAATEAMLTRQAGNDERLNGAGYGTWQRSRNNPAVFGHGGDLPGAHTEYAVVPETGVGIYVAINGDGRGVNPLHGLRDALVTEFLQRFAGVPAPDDPVPDADAGDYGGTYLTTRASQSDASALKTALDQFTVRRASDGTLHTTHPMLPEQVWTPVGAGVYQEQPSGDRMAFLVEDGKVVGLATDDDPSQAYVRVPWYGDPHVHLSVAAGALVVLTTTLVWPLAALVRWVRGRPRAAPPAARLVAAGAALLCVGFAGFVLYAVGRMEFLQGLLFTGSPVLQVPLAVASLCTLGAIAAAVAAWKQGWWGVFGRVHYSAVTLAAAVVVAVGVQYNLVWLP